MGNISESLDKIECKKENFKELYKIFDSVNDVPVITFNLKIGAFLIRQRINEKDRFFELESELSHPPSKCCREYNRANIPDHPMFYSSMTVEENVPCARIVSLTETSDFFKNVESCGIERSTISKWNVIKTLNLLALPFNDNYQRSNLFIDTTKGEWNKNLFSIKNKYSEDAIELIEYMSREISKQCNDSEGYFKIANFVYYLLYVNQSTKHFDGIMYPSVSSAGEGLNVVLKPEIADKKLQFKSASVCNFAKKGSEAISIIVNDARSKDINGNLKYIERELSESTKNEYNKLASDLSFIN